MTTFAARLAVLAGASALALTACATAAEPESPGASPEPEMSATHDAMDDAMEEPTDEADAMEDDAMSDDSMESVEVPEALQFTTTTLAGAEFDGASLVGQDAIVWVWASWCPICQSEAPAVAAANEQLPDGVTIYGLPGNADLASSQQFVEEYGLGDIEHIFTEDGSLWSNFGVSYQPALVLINDDGTFETMPGSSGEAQIIEAAEQLAAS
ncbi:redoxin domain-containing protein [Demequina activiva]|uniref:Thioredoxin domain-containing protein n=1 Tax=Demequina activiva TaxID=1582364 RepID=A0A919UKU6_9MICO|nr:redoxin domain-containing protein [Demequina activiva]GIG54058.1 hypothetical protein Dac01nite_08100 [Demequina activiva]